MAIDLVLLPAGSHPGKAKPVRSLRLDDDGYYWFLHPWIKELAERTGKYIDLYGDERFAVHELPQLRSLLAKARTAAGEGPTTWRVHVGTQSAPVPRELYEQVDKKKLERLLDELEELITECERSGGEIHCIGD